MPLKNNKFKNMKTTMMKKGVVEILKEIDAETLEF